MRGKLTGERPAFIGPPPARSLAPWRYAPSHTMVLRLTRQDSGLHVHARLSPTSPALHLQRIQTRRESIIGSAAHWRCRPSLDKKCRPLEVPPIIGSAARHSPISHALHLHARPLAGPSPGPFTCTTALRRSLWRHAMVITVTGLVASCPRLVTSRPSSGLVASRPSSGLVTSRRRVARRKGAGSARWQAISSCHGGTVQWSYESILAGGGSSAR